MFTLGGAAGGTYYFRGNLVGRDNSDPSTSLGGNDDSLSDKGDSGKNSDDRSPENKSDSSTGKEISDTVSKNSDSGNEGVENSPTSPE
ncbi:hypothetical protein MSUIS_00930 [Mycoplasma suis KI3806]|uniref:Uncharacterized protein n=1 Tax=Mycoplasma suis (strain KI_3806) TaxID=708248 RepID=F0V2W4_MYCS3|nr:hypothetical protein MSUIS_00930 [Mycoplasma suis KI3806]